MRKWTFLGLAILTGLLTVAFLKRQKNEDVVLCIYSVEDWQEFARSVNEGEMYSAEMVRLCADLDFADVEDPIMAGVPGSEDLYFAGTFDGSGHQIRNFTMHAERASGLFYNLGGNVCNLTVLYSDLSAERYRGVIAANMQQDAVIANCRAAYYTENGQELGFSGNSEGSIKNCWGFEEMPTVEELNQGLGALSGSCQVEAWYLWEDSEDGPVLTTQEATTLSDMETRISVGSGLMELLAYYSEQEMAWCFALPAGCVQEELEVEVTFTDGSNIHMTCRTDEMTACEKEGILYPIKCLQGKECPALVIQTQSQSALQELYQSKDNEVGGAYSLYHTDGTSMNSGLISAMGSRGNHSWHFAKKGFNLELSEKTDLYGMGASLNYILIPGYRDNSLITYKLTADLAQQVGMDYAPETRFVHLYIDGNYMGLYFLTQKIEISEERFDLQNSRLVTEQLNDRKLKDYEQLSWQDTESSVYHTWYDIPNSPEDLTGGYILEMDGRTFDEDKSRFVSSRGNSVVLRSNPYATKKQVDYVADLWQEFEDALYAEDGYNEKGCYYTDYIDLASFADQWIFYELNMETSVFSSVYIYKDSDRTGDGLFHAVYPWDNEHGYVMEDKHAAKSWFEAYFEEDGYWRQFTKHKDFKEAVDGEWKEKFLPALTEATKSENGLFSQYMVYIEDGKVNSSRWYNCPYEERLKEIWKIVEERADFLTRAFEIMDDQYVYFRFRDDTFFGVTADGEYIPLEE